VFSTVSIFWPYGIKERGTVIEFMGAEQVYIVVTEQPEEIIKSKSSV
jgi:hypothetical protein